MSGRFPTSACNRFVEKCEPRESGCIEWTGGTTAKGSKGYGLFCVNGKMMSAHRWLYEQINGKLPEEIDVCHSCDNRKGVNIDHLFAGTRKQNMEDAVRKGRMSHVARGKGETHPMAVFTQENVNRIRERFRRGETQSAMAREFEVTVNAIHCIVRFKPWR